jgi:hypothetical protein
MQQWHGNEDYADLPEWHALASVSGRLKQVALTLTLPPEKEWLRHVLGEVSDQMMTTIRWTAETTPRHTPEGSEGIHPDVYIVPADAARSDVVVALYCLDFLRSESLIEEAAGEELNASLSALQFSLEALIARLRQGQVNPPRFANN